VVAGKTVPPVPVRGAAALAPELLQAAADRGWPAYEALDLGGWRLRAAEGFTNRANSVLPLGDPGMPFEAAVETVSAWYAERALPVKFQTVVGDALDARFAALGWGVTAEAIFRTGRLAAMRDRLDGVPTDAVEVVDRVDDAWMSLYRRTGGAVTPAVRHVIAGPPGTLFALIREPGTGKPIAIGRCALDLGAGADPGLGRRLAGFAAVEVAKSHRRQGLARMLMRALTDRALAAGAVTAWLQVEPDNAPARALYDSLGFSDHHRYHYRREP
jgi:GNAT superfamily N-acetyltransferase